MKLGEVGNFISGINPSRVKRDIDVGFDNLYSQEMFDCDYELRKGNKKLIILDDMQNYRLRENDVLIRSVSTKAILVSKDHAGAIYTANFIKADFDPEIIYNKYFIYIYNCNKAVAKQLTNNVQGTLLSRVTTSILKELDIPVPSLEVQKLIGDIYYETLKLKHLYKVKAELLELLVDTCLTKAIEEKEA